MIGILVLYASYFALVAYISFFQSASFKDMKHSYKVSMIMTLAVIFACAVVFGLISEGTDLNSRATLNVALTALMNLYLYLIAYLYSPAMESLEDIQLKHARKEHEHIMNQFYEQELPDITHRTTVETEMAPKEAEASTKPGQPEKRSRYMKKDAKEKAKEKLWESIIKETEDEASSGHSSSSSEGHEI